MLAICIHGEPVPTKRDVSFEGWLKARHRLNSPRRTLLVQSIAVLAVVISSLEVGRFHVRSV